MESILKISTRNLQTEPMGSVMKQICRGSGKIQSNVFQSKKITNSNKGSQSDCLHIKTKTHNLGLDWFVNTSRFFDTSQIISIILVVMIYADQNHLNGSSKIFNKSEKINYGLLVNVKYFTEIALGHVSFGAVVT